VKETNLRRQLSIGWMLVLFVVAGPPIGAFLLSLFSGDLFSGLLVFPVVALVSYKVSSWAPMLAAGLFWVGCRIYAVRARKLTLQIGGFIGFVAGFVAMAVRSLTNYEVSTVAGVSEATSTGLATSAGLTLVGGFVAALCGLWSIYMSKS
jgi:hypothetical protein